MDEFLFEPPFEVRQWVARQKAKRNRSRWAKQLLTCVGTRGLAHQEDMAQRGHAFASSLDGRVVFDVECLSSLIVGVSQADVVQPRHSESW